MFYQEDVITKFNLKKVKYFWKALLPLACLLAVEETCVRAWGKEEEEEVNCSISGLLAVPLLIGLS